VKLKTSEQKACYLLLMKLLERDYLVLDNKFSFEHRSARKIEKNAFP